MQEYSDNLLSEFSELDPWSNTGVRRTVPNDYRDGYTPSLYMHKQKGDNLQPMLIKLDPWRSACGR